MRQLVRHVHFQNPHKPRTLSARMQSLAFVEAVVPGIDTIERQSVAVSR